MIPLNLIVSSIPQYRKIIKKNNHYKTMVLKNYLKCQYDGGWNTDELCLIYQSPINNKTYEILTNCKLFHKIDEKYAWVEIPQLKEYSNEFYAGFKDNMIKKLILIPVAAKDIIKEDLESIMLMIN